MLFSVVWRAEMFARFAHWRAKNKRKYTDEPYIVHPEEVIALLHFANPTKEMLAAGWLHDVVEDAGVPLWLIYLLFGKKIGSMVRWLTHITKPSDGKRAVRMEIESRRLAEAPPDVQTVKLADTISNTKTIAQYDARFAKVYLEEKRFLLSIMTDGNPILYRWACEVVGYKKNGG